MDQSYFSTTNNNNNNNNYMNAKNNCSEGLVDEVNDAQPHHNHQFNFVKRVVPLTSSASPGTTKTMGRHRTSISEPKSFMSSPSNNLNSLDFWDYTIELECLQGPKGLCVVFCFFFSFFINGSSGTLSVTCVDFLNGN